MMKQAQKIEVGLHEGRPGFTVEYTDGERVHFVFHRSIAQALANGLNKIVDELNYLDRQMLSQPISGAPSSGVRVGEECRVQLAPPKTLGIQSGEGVDIDDNKRG